ncbi:MAG: pyruvate ferredoxin oxidoreductase [Lentisphaerae bacterium]|nr:pyruvate ferredoxin oxidoreductase [Lentisphaerota bacterium]
MMSKTINIIVAGLGGQGVLKASDIVAEAVFSAGFDVKKSEVHGMSQRGGSVSSEVRYGEDVASPMIPAGETDFLLVLEDTQIEVNKPKLKADGKLITLSDVDASKLENPKTINIAMLGVLSASLPDIPEQCWIDALKKFLPEKHHAVNLTAFALGRGK